MNELSNAYTDHETVHVVLEGGPGDFPENARRRQTARDEPVIKVMHRGGYEHFERVSEPSPRGDSAPVVYCWTARTRIAE
jgi:hypothetical protein